MTGLHRHPLIGRNMIELTESAGASRHIHTVPADPGICWSKDPAAAIDAPPDEDADPLPEARWSSTVRRTGICGAVSPRVLSLPGGTLRMYYTQILPRRGFPNGANDYENSTTRILSAISQDGGSWAPEPGVRLSPQAGGAGDGRVVSSEVVPAGNGQRLRMYYECCQGAHTEPNSIRSALSEDGLTWTLEPGARMEAVGSNFAAPRIILLDNGRVRLYCLERGRGIISALSDDGGITFRRESGVRVAPTGPHDALVAFAPEIVCVADAGYVMYYAGYSAPNRACILRAVSDDGLSWRKDAAPVLSPGPDGWDAAKCSEMCLFRPPANGSSRPIYRMVYEACDGSAKDARGVWRIASATSMPLLISSTETDAAMSSDRHNKEV